MNVFITGEGFHELGDWYDRTYQKSPPARGIIEALLLKLDPGAAEIVGGVAWKNIRKFKAGNHLKPETRNVLGAAVKASELDCDVLVFVRDRDSDPDREAHIAEGIESARALFPELPVAGGVAIEQIEAWILACLGHRGSERHKDSKGALAQTGTSTGQQMVDAIDGCDLTSLPDDAASLRRWLDHVRAALASAG